MSIESVFSVGWRTFAAAVPLVLSATPSLATAPIVVPEPGTISLLAGGVAAAVVAYRLRKRK